MTKPRTAPTSARGKLLLAKADAVGIDAKQIAARVKVNPATAHRWLNGSRLPQGKQIQVLTILGITAEEWEQASAEDGEAKPAPLAVSLEPGRWRAIAARYPRFARTAQLALEARAVTEGLLDVVADALGAHKGDGPSDHEIEEAMQDAIAERNRWSKLAPREGTAAEFGEGGDDA